MNLTKLFRSIHDKNLNRVIKEAVKFDVTEAYQKMQYDPVPENFTKIIKSELRLPYKLTLFNFVFELQGVNLELFILLADTSIGVTTVLFTREKGDQMYREQPCYAVTNDQGTLIQFDNNQYIKNRGEHERMLQTAVMVSTLFLKRINNKQVTIINQKPRGVKARNIKKLKQFSYNVLIIKHETTINLQKGDGTHRSPRPHDRMGHERHLKSGKVIWINSMQVNPDGKGSIDKEYKIL